MTDPNRLFAEAEGHFRAKRYDDARRALQTLDGTAKGHAPVHHLRALVEKAAGRSVEARAAFERALAIAPGDCQIWNNQGNLLREMGDGAAALESYDRALAIAPGFVQAAFNRAVTLDALGNLGGAESAYAALEATLSDQATYWSARGKTARDTLNLEHAAACYDRAIVIDANHRQAAHGRALVALERGEPEAPSLFSRVREQWPQDLSIALGDIQTRLQQGDDAAAVDLDRLIERNPYWIEGRKVRAGYMWERGHESDFQDEIAQVRALLPIDAQLSSAMIDMLTGVEMYEQAANEAADLAAKLPDHPGFRLAEAVNAAQCGDLDRAHGAFADLSTMGFLYPVPEARLRLQQGRIEEALILLDRARVDNPDDIAAWAYSDLAWRLAGDDRHNWLHGQDGLYAMRPLAIDASEIETIADYLRGLHSTLRHPVGQSMRKGTQTRGALLSRLEPEARRLNEVLEDAVRVHWTAMPAYDPAHPLLRHRKLAPAFRGSWSVRLTDGGFHIAHMHPHGLLSSASYWVMPPGAGEDDGAGSLELGAQPAELGLNLEPIAVFNPAPGQLALFPSTILHGTRPFRAGERITLAFDVVAR